MSVGLEITISKSPSVHGKASARFIYSCKNEAPVLLCYAPLVWRAHWDYGKLDLSLNHHHLLTLSASVSFFLSLSCNSHLPSKKYQETESDLISE